MADAGSFREIARSVTVSYPIPFLIALLLAFALASFGVSLAASTLFGWIILGLGTMATLSAVALAAYAVLLRPELLRSERYLLTHRAMDIIGADDVTERGRQTLATTMKILLADEQPRPRHDEQSGTGSSRND